MVLGIFGRCFLGIHLDNSDRTSVPMQRGVRFRIFRSILMQRGARFAVFDVPTSASCWAHRGCQKCCKTTAFFDGFEHEGRPANGCRKACLAKYIENNNVLGTHFGS